MREICPHNPMGVLSGPNLAKEIGRRELAEADEGGSATVTTPPEAQEDTLLGMTLVIQLFVYPSAFATHGLWATALLLLVARGPGVLSLDHLLRVRSGAG